MNALEYDMVVEMTSCGAMDELMRVCRDKDIDVFFEQQLPIG